MNKSKSDSKTDPEKGPPAAAPRAPSAIAVTFTVEELNMLTALASDQLFRREFIDPKMPGYKSNSAEVRAGKALVARLRSLLDSTPTTKAPQPKVAGARSGA
jgi:hypothetical protein